MAKEDTVNTFTESRKQNLVGRKKANYSDQESTQPSGLLAEG